MCKQSAAWTVRDNPAYLTPLNILFKQTNEKLVLNVSVRQLLFEGFTVSVSITQIRRQT